MEEVSRFAVGLDVGTENVRAVMTSLDKDGALSVVGYGEAPNIGMRKGSVVNLSGPAEAIDKVLGEVERMTGREIDSAVVSINGTSIYSFRTTGMIVTGPENHEINEEDLARIEDVAVRGQLPPNLEVLEVVPLEYSLDNHTGIKNPLGMVGTKLEVRTNVVSALAQNCMNLRRTTEGVKVAAERLVPSVVAAAEVVMNEAQAENGVAIVDIGAATTGVAIFEEGDLQHVGVIPIGSNNITNDLAIVLEISREVAEDIKRRFVTGAFSESEKEIIIKQGREELRFDRFEVNELVKGRLKEIFEAVRKELKQAHYDKRLPEGIVLVGGGAKMRDIEIYAKEVLEAAVRVGVPNGFNGVAEAVAKPEYAAAAGLALMAARVEGQRTTKKLSKHQKQKQLNKNKDGWLKSLLKKF